MRHGSELATCSCQLVRHCRLLPCRLCTGIRPDRAVRMRLWGLGGPHAGDSLKNKVAEQNTRRLRCVQAGANGGADAGGQRGSGDNPASHGATAGAPRAPALACASLSSDTEPNGWAVCKRQLQRKKNTVVTPDVDRMPCISSVSQLAGPRTLPLLDGGRRAGCRYWTRQLVGGRALSCESSARCCRSFGLA